MTTPMTNGSANNEMNNALISVGWTFDNLFNQNDIPLLLNDVAITKEKAEQLATTGLTLSTADERGGGMWTKVTLGTGDSTSTIFDHYFDRLYQKLACCMNMKQIIVPMYDKTTNQVTYKQLTIDPSSSACNINGIDWYDDNITEQGYNPKCEELMDRLIAFLSKYDPSNPMIGTYGGCTSNRFVDTSNPISYALTDVNRSCLVPQCASGSAYKRKQDRKSCTTTLCQANMSFNDLDAGHAIDLYGNSIKQSCGPDTTLMKSINDSTGTGSISNETTNETTNVTTNETPSSSSMDNTTPPSNETEKNKDTTSNPMTTPMTNPMTFSDLWSQNTGLFIATIITSLIMLFFIAWASLVRNALSMILSMISIVAFIIEVGILISKGKTKTKETSS